MKEYWVDDRGQIHRRGNNQATSPPTQTRSYTPTPIQQTNNNTNGFVENTTFWIVTTVISPIIYGLLGYFLAYPILESLGIYYLSPFACSLICTSIALVTAVIYNSKQYGIFETKNFISLTFPLGIIVGIAAVVSLLIVVIGIIVVIIAIGLFLGG